jgi:hypothetical protein
MGGRLFLRWKEFTGAHHTWEPEEKLHCPALTETFFTSLKASKEKEGTERKSLSDSKANDGKPKKKEALPEVSILKESWVPQTAVES